MPGMEVTNQWHFVEVVLLGCVFTPKVMDSLDKIA